jgi:tetratricopeptide (TPR) repeat protein
MKDYPWVLADKHILKAKLYIVDYQFDKAEEEYKKALAIWSSFENYIVLADYYYDLMFFSKAIDYYKQALTKTLAMGLTRKKKLAILWKIKKAQFYIYIKKIVCKSQK